MGVILSLCRAINISSFLQGQLLQIFVVIVVPLFELCFPVSSFSLTLCIGVCTFEKMTIFPSFVDQLHTRKAFCQSALLELFPVSRGPYLVQIYTYKFLIKGIFWFLFKEYIIFVLMSAYCTVDPLKQQQTAQLFFFFLFEFSAAPRPLDFLISHQHSETDQKPWAAPCKI